VSPFLALRTGRKKLLVSAALCVAMFPLLLVLVNMAWLYGHSGWTTVRVSPLVRAHVWLESLFDGESAEGVGGRLTLGRMIWIFIPTMTRGLSPLFAILMFGGIWGWRRVWGRRDHQALFGAAVIVLGGVWVQLWYDRTICPRYAMPIVLMAAPFAALGLLGLADRLVRMARQLRWERKGQIVVLATAATVIVAVNLGVSLTSSRSYFKTRRIEVDTGRWLGREFPAPLRIVGPLGVAPVVSYYAGGDASHTTFRWDASDAAILAMVKQRKADVVILRPSRQLTPKRCLALVERMRWLGLAPVGADILPDASDEFHLLVRARWLQVARQSTQSR
jgi:hypothetical protein